MTAIAHTSLRQAGTVDVRAASAAVAGSGIELASLSGRILWVVRTTCSSGVPGRLTLELIGGARVVGPTVAACHSPTAKCLWAYAFYHTGRV